MKSRCAVFAAAALLACGGGSSGGSTGASSVERTSAAGAEQTAGAGAAVTSADAGVVEGRVDAGVRPVAARLEGVPSRLAEGEAVILAGIPGGVVSMRREGASAVDLRDGERVRVLQEAGGMGADEQLVEIEVRSMRGEVGNGSLVTESSLRRSADGRWAVFHAIESCGDFCHARLTLLGPEGVRRSLCGEELCAGPELSVSFSADGSSVAVSSVDLRVATVRDGTTRTIEGFSSAVYTPQGRLFARKTSETDDGVYEIVASGAPQRVFSARGRPPRRDPEVPPGAPITPVLEQNGAVLCAQFERGRAMIVARATLDGRAVAGTQPCAR